jgi:mannose-6-phosphate isomerase-like protein (cupin superfamily)
MTIKYVYDILKKKGVAMTIDLSLIEQARKENRIHIFENAFPNLPSWDTLLKVIAGYVEEDLEKYPDRSYLDTENLEEEYLSFKLKCRFWSRLAFQLNDPSDPYMEIIPELKPITEWGLSVYPKDIYTNNFGLVTFMKNKGVVGKHHYDLVDQFQWVAQGEMIWRTGHNLENEYHVKAGDFLFIPKLLEHEIETFKAPRACINLAIRN